MSLSERDKSYIFDMINYSQEIIDITNNETHATFINSRVKRLAIERLIEIIGEAANHVSKEMEYFVLWMRDISSWLVEQVGCLEYFSPGQYRRGFAQSNILVQNDLLVNEPHQDPVHTILSRFVLYVF